MASRARWSPRRSFQPAAVGDPWRRQAAKTGGGARGRWRRRHRDPAHGHVSLTIDHRGDSMWSRPTPGWRGSWRSWRPGRVIVRPRARAPLAGSPRRERCLLGARFVGARAFRLTPLPPGEGFRTSPLILNQITGIAALRAIMAWPYWEPQLWPSSVLRHGLEVHAVHAGHQRGGGGMPTMETIVRTLKMSFWAMPTVGPTVASSRNWILSKSWPS